MEKLRTRGAAEPANGEGYVRKSVYWIASGFALMTVVVVRELVGSAERDAQDASTGVAPATWLVLGFPLLMAAWTWAARNDQCMTAPPLAYRCGFHMSGLATAVLIPLVALTFAEASLYPDDFRILITVVVVAVLLQFATTGRLLDLWSRAPHLRNETGSYIVHISTHWAIVVALLGATLLRIDAAEITTDAMVAASVLAVPYVIQVLWRIRQSTQRVGAPAAEVPVTRDLSQAGSEHSVLRARGFLGRAIAWGICVTAFAGHLRRRQ